MNTDLGGWRPLTPETIARLPQSGAVFEIANLVRNVHFIGAAGGNLRARLVALSREQAKLMPTPGGYYVRYEQAEREDEALAMRLDSYRAIHRGRMPFGNADIPTVGRPVPRVVARRAA